MLNFLIGAQIVTTKQMKKSTCRIESAPSPTNEELIDGNGKYTNYSNEGKISNMFTVLNLFKLSMNNQEISFEERNMI